MGVEVAGSSQEFSASLARWAGRGFSGSYVRLEGKRDQMGSKLRH